MTTVSTDIAQTNARIGSTTFKKNVSPGAGNVKESMLDFILDIDPDFLSSADIETLATLLDDIDWLSQKELNEALHFAKKSTTGARSTARKWYRANKSRVKKLQARLKKSKAAKKRKEIMAKSQRTGEKRRKKKKYHTKDHVSEVMNRNITKRAKQVVEKWFEPLRYRVIRGFSLNKSVSASLNELVEFHGNQTYVLEKRDGRRFKFKVNKALIEPFIKLEYLVEVDDFV